LFVLLAGVACDAGRDAPPPVTAATPAEHEAGETLFETHCASCHGERAAGTDQGPPLVHRIYEPSHHGDAAFQLAVARGVAAHHWRFGDMAAVPGVTVAEVEQIVGYVRWLQREAGIE
jgi:mono/diheme cytochrome c family protein